MRQGIPVFSPAGIGAIPDGFAPAERVGRSFAGQPVRPRQPFDERSSRRNKVPPSTRHGCCLSDTSWQEVFSPRRFLARRPFSGAIIDPPPPASSRRSAAWLLATTISLKAGRWHWEPFGATGLPVLFAAVLAAKNRQRGRCENRGSAATCQGFMGRHRGYFAPCGKIPCLATSRGDTSPAVPCCKDQRENALASQCQPPQAVSVAWAFAHVGARSDSELLGRDGQRAIGSEIADVEREQVRHAVRGEHCYQPRVMHLFAADFVPAYKSKPLGEDLGRLGQ